MAEPDPPPVPEFDDPPWEEPGVLRRDCEPHRGNWLLLLASVTMLCGVLAFVLAVPAFVGIPLGFLTGRMARRDLNRMAEGSLDSQGHEQTFRALCRAEDGVYLNAYGLVASPLCCCGVYIAGGLFVLLLKTLGLV